MNDEETVRNGLVEAADRLFYARGVQAVGMDAVRAEAGVSLKRIYALFPSKDDLVTAVLRHRSALWDAGVGAGRGGRGGPGRPGRGGGGEKGRGGRGVGGGGRARGGGRAAQRMVSG
jgi:hypothetical protein